MMIPSPARNVCVLGMHRSGSSLVTELLVANGFSAGSNLIGASGSNPDGHYEDRFLVQMSKRLLLSMGGTWDRPPAFPVGWMDDPRVRRWREQTRDYLAAMPDQGRGRVFKDPRACLLLPFFQAAAGPLAYVVTLRNRSDVGSSILRRNAEWRAPARLPWRLARAAWHHLHGGYEPIHPITPEAADALWDRYYQDLLGALRGQTVHLMHYEALLADPAGESTRLLAALGVPVAEARWDVVRPDFNNGRAREVDAESRAIADRLRQQNPPRA
jgi:hypothetical protein